MKREGEGSSKIECITNPGGRRQSLFVNANKGKGGEGGGIENAHKLWFGKLPQFRIKPYERSKSQAREPSTYTRAITQLTAKSRSLRPTRVSSQFSNSRILVLSPLATCGGQKTAARVSKPITITVEEPPASPRGRMNTCSMHAHKIICVGRTIAGNEMPTPPQREAIFSVGCCCRDNTERGGGI